MIFPAPASAAIACPKTAASATGRTNISSALRMATTFSRSRRWRSTSTTRAAARRRIDPRRPAQHGQKHRRRRGADLRRELPAGCRRHAIQRQRNRRPQTDGDGRRDARPRPYVEHWYELEKQDTYPAPGHRGADSSATRTNWRTSGSRRTSKPRLRSAKPSSSPSRTSRT